MQLFTVSCVLFIFIRETALLKLDIHSYFHVLIWFLFVSLFHFHQWLRWHPLANVLLGGTSEGDVWMWKIPSGDCKMMQGHGCQSTCGKIMPDGKRCIVGYEDGSSKVWDLKDQVCVHHIKQGGKILSTLPKKNWMLFKYYLVSNTAVNVKTRKKWRDAVLMPAHGEWDNVWWLPKWDNAVA